MAKKKGSKRKVAITVAIILLVLIAAYFIATSAMRESKEDSQGDHLKLDAFAKCLSNMSVKMYGADWCGHCKNNEGFFANGDSSEGKELLIDNGIYNECNPQGENSKAQECLDAGIQGYPTWSIKGKLYPGEQTLVKLAALSGCNLSGE